MTPIRSLCILSFAALLAGCHASGRPGPGVEVPRPDEVTAFPALYSANCAGCHGATGQGGAATDLANPEYLALVDDNTLRDIIAHGEKGTLMPAFATDSGGSLTDAQVSALVQGLRRWAQPVNWAGITPPPYRATHPGDPAHGQTVYAQGCARCHGPNARQPGPAGSILDGTFLALVNDQTLRTTVLAGRPDIGQPDFRNIIPGHPLSDAELTDVTAWLISQRPARPGHPYPNTQPTSERPGEQQPLSEIGH